MDNQNRAEDRLKEYFNLPMEAPPYLVSDTMKRIRQKDKLGRIIGAAVLNSMMVMLLAVFLLAGPLPPSLKLGISIFFCLIQMIAATLVVYFTLRETRKPSSGLAQ